MAEYIDREQVLELQADYGEGQYTMMLIDPKLVKKLPTADVAPVVHAKWLKDIEYIGDVECSNCGKRYDEDVVGGSSYCPNCGARMDKE